MLFTDSVYVGVDFSARHQVLTYAVLDRDLSLVTLASAKSDDVLAFLGGQKSVLVAVNSPLHVNRGVVGKNLPSAGPSARNAKMRLAEYELRWRGIAVRGTDAKESLCPAGVRAGFAFYKKLTKLRFESYPDENKPHQYLETNSHADFCALLGARPLPRSRLEGRLQRELLLYELQLKIHDPMDFFEEITRHKLLNGLLPLELVHSSAQLDAMVAAYTAWLVAEKPGGFAQVGNLQEGFITLPVSALKEKY